MWATSLRLVNAARLLAAVLCFAPGPLVLAASYKDVLKSPHHYFERTPTDRFTRLKDNLESGRLDLDRSNEKTFVLSLLKALEIPASSQMLVFSTTSLQLSLISPSNPRALYFSDDLYLGYVPGGRIEIVSLDADLGGIFYIFDIPKSASPIRIERSERCLKCHASADTGYVPGLVIKSVLPGPTGGSLDAFRQEKSGHEIPLDQRFGGWYVTGAPDSMKHWGNLIGRLSPQGTSTYRMPPGKQFDFARYPAATSDILPQLLHEHQAGFVNRAVEAIYRTRTYLDSDHGRLTSEHAADLDQQARLITRYLLFAGEAPLPAGGVTGDKSYKTDFLKDRRPNPAGKSLKDFDLRTRLFAHRCSYLIYSPLFQSLPAVIKQGVYRHLGLALSLQRPDKEYAYLPPAEKQTIHSILKATLNDLPPGW